MRRPIHVLLNPAAGLSGGTGAEALSDRFRAAGVDAEVRACAPAKIPDEARAAADAGVEVLAVAGGDGSLRGAAEALLGSRTALAVLPTGTLNHYARRLGIANMDTAIAALLEPRLEPQSVGIVSGRLFLNTATFGAYSEIVERRERLRRYAGKWPGAAVSFLLAMSRIRHRRMTLRLEDETLHHRTPMVWVGVGRGSFPNVLLSEEQPAADPLLEVVVFTADSRYALFALSARVMWNLARNHTGFDDRRLTVRHTATLLIESKHRVGVTLDGEIMPKVRSAEVEIRKDALPFVVP